MIDPLRLENAVWYPTSAARCSGCHEMDDIDLLVPKRKLTSDGAVTTEYRHYGCEE